MTSTASTAQFSPTGPADIRFENRFVRVDETPVTLPAGGAGTYVTVTPGLGFGGVAIPVITDGDGVRVGLVRQHRFPVGAFTWEFPRGGTSDLSEAETARELVEEMDCLVISAPTQLGVVRPDTGLLTTSVAVWLFTVIPSVDHDFQESESGASHVWVTEATLRQMIVDGEIECGITLAAWALRAAAQ